MSGSLNQVPTLSSSVIMSMLEVRTGRVEGCGFEGLRFGNLERPGEISQICPKAKIEPVGSKTPKP